MLWMPRDHEASLWAEDQPGCGVFMPPVHEGPWLLMASTQIPSWFIHFTTFVLVMMIPWAIWISKQSVEMGIKQTFILERLVKIEKAQDK